MILEVLRSDRFTLSDRLEIVFTLDTPWPESFTIEAIRALSQSKMSKIGDLGSPIPYADLFASLVYPSETSVAALQEFIALVIKDKPPPSLARCLDVVRLRISMHKEFST